jgi:hypothetical protein
MLKTMIEPLLACVLGTLLIAAAPALASKTEKSEHLVNLHDLKTTVAIGDYYLKQESLQAARSYLFRLGKAQQLGDDWKPGNAYWNQAEDAIVAALMRRVGREFSNMEWLSQAWSQINQSDFSEPDLDALLAHLRTDVGRKQVMIVDHTVAFHVVTSLTMSGKLQDNLPGADAERKRMQDLYTAEDDAMRFDSNDNPEGTQFAFSPLGKKYFVNAVLKVSGLVIRRLYQVAGELPQQVEAAAPQVQTAVNAYRKTRS